MVKVAAIIQARLSSQRLPGKVLKDLHGKTLLERVIGQAQKSSSVDEIWLATSAEPEDDLLEIAGRRLGVSVYRGPLDNVLQRFYETAEHSGADLIVRITADNPLVEPRFIDQGLAALQANRLDYVGMEHVPYGTGIEVFTRQALIRAAQEATSDYEREHVTPYILNHPEKFNMIKIQPELKHLQREDVRLTIDTMEDYVKMYKLFYHLENQKIEVALEQAIQYIDKLPELLHQDGA
ncbi:cytidylyltransferase domain-containing protein [Paenibacillus barengoltzii]|uniref:cytidylyltransferase domain-containing protein n=1 Tax=Paenibacillus barengoltzii TaxID=343517 RepID=UPI00387A1088